MKRTLIGCLCTFLLVGCSAKQTTKSNEVKTEYEALNGTTNSSGKEHRTVTIPEDAPFVLAQPADIIQKAEAGESFFVVYSDPLCPWCRSVIEAACQSAKENNIETIYMVNIWDKDGNEIFRDKYEIKDSTISKVSDGTAEYQKTLDIFDTVLGEYTLQDSNGTVFNVGEKRIFAPNFISVKEGKAIAMTEGISDLQTDAREELTDEIKQDEVKIFNEFFQK